MANDAVASNTVLLPGADWTAARRRRDTLHGRERELPILLKRMAALRLTGKASMLRSTKPTSFQHDADFPSFSPSFSGLRPLLGTVPCSKACDAAHGELNGLCASAALLRTVPTIPTPVLPHTIYAAFMRARRSPSSNAPR